MKKLLLIALLLPTAAQPKSWLPALRDVREKIDKTVNQVSSITLKDALGGKRVVSGPHEVIVGERSLTLEQLLASSEQRLAALHWANRHADAEAIKSAAACDVRSRIKAMIETRAGGQAISTVQIAGQLADEQKVLDQVNTDHLRMPGLLKTEQDNKFFKSRVQQLREAHCKAQQTLRELAKALDSLLAL